MHIRKKELGYHIATCINGEEAIDYYKDKHEEIDVVILDLIMPKMSG